MDRFIPELADDGGIRCIVAAGGDGTVGSVINRFPGLPITILPLGTENLLARYLGIPRCGRSVADLVANGSMRVFDVGTVGERRFTVMASIGFDADVVHRVSSKRQGRIWKIFYLQPIIESLRKYTYPALSVRIDGAEVPAQARLVVAVNLPAYALNLPVAQSARGNDGLLDLRLFRRGSAFQMLRYCYKLALNRHEQLGDVDCLTGREIRVEADEPVPIQIDGDPAGTTPVTIRVLPAALTVVVPG